MFRFRSPQPAVTTAAMANSSIHSIGAHPPRVGKAARGATTVWFRMAFTCLLGLVAACSREPPEVALRAAIAAMEEAAERRDADALAEAISEEFTGPEGMDRDRFRRYAAVAWLRYQQVGVQLGPLDVELVGERAKVDFTAATSGGAGWLPDRSQVYQVRTGWRLESGEWKLISASWEPVL